jgi:predicted DCC family thiol-disulfide oxidoreductase YuxK
MDHPILLYDGVCYLCNWLVRFALKRDARGRLRFSSLQSAKGQELLQAYGVSAGDLDTVWLIEDGRIYDRSTCALRAVRYLRFPWPLFYGLIIVPRSIRDALYDFVARRRYAWFGRMDSCPIPPPELRERFLA